jgi:NitT/TauT family transport system permease protein
MSGATQLQDAGRVSVLQRLCRGAALPLALGLLWEMLARVGRLSADTLPAPSRIALAGWEALGSGSVWLASLQTLGAALGGLALATFVGVLGGVALGLSPRAARIMGPAIEGMRPVPAVALMPLALLIFGFGASMEIAVVAFACVWPILVITTSAVQGIEPRLLDVARVLEMSASVRLRTLILPAALPRIGVALRLALGIALVVAVTVEIALDPRGLGHELMSAQQSLQPALMYAWLFWIGVIGWGVNRLMAGIGARHPLGART